MLANSISWLHPRHLPRCFARLPVRGNDHTRTCALWASLSSPHSLLVAVKSWSESVAGGSDESRRLCPTVSPSHHLTEHTRFMEARHGKFPGGAEKHDFKGLVKIYVCAIWNLQRPQRARISRLLTMPVVRKGWERQKDPKAAKPDKHLAVYVCTINPNASWMVTTDWQTPGMFVKGGVHLIRNLSFLGILYTVYYTKIVYPPPNNQRFTCHGVVVTISWCSSACCDFAAIWQVEWWRLAMSSFQLRRGLHPPNAGSQRPFKLT